MPFKEVRVHKKINVSRNLGIKFLAAGKCALRKIRRAVLRAQFELQNILKQNREV